MELRPHGLLIGAIVIATVATAAVRSTPAGGRPGATGLVPKGAFILAGPTSTVSVGSEVDVTMRLNTVGHTANVVQADATYPADRLQLLSVDSTGSPFPSQFVNQSRPGLVSLAVGVVPGNPAIAGSNLLVFTMRFRAIATGSGTVDVAGDALFPAVDQNFAAWPVTRGFSAVTIGAPDAFSVDRLAIDRLSQGAKHAMAIAGAGFAGPTTVTVGGDGVTVTKVAVSNGTQVKGKFVVSSTASSGYRDVTVISNGRTRTCVACLYVVPMTVSSVNPTTVARGTSAPIHIAGSFSAVDYKVTAGNGVTFSGVHLGTGGLDATVTVDSSAKTKPRNVRVTDLDDFGTAQCNGCFAAS